MPLDIVIEERAPENSGLLMMALCERLWKEGHSIIGTENMDKNDSNNMEFLVQGILKLDDGRKIWARVLQDTSPDLPA